MRAVLVLLRGGGVMGGPYKAALVSKAPEI